MATLAQNSAYRRCFHFSAHLPNSLESYYDNVDQCMKRTELLFSVLLLPLDFLALVAAGYAAYRLRFFELVTDVRPVLYDISLTEYLPSVAGVAFVWIIIFALLGLYTRRSTDSWWGELGKVMVGCAMGLTLIIIVVFFQRQFFSSRFVLLAGTGLAIVLVSMVRLLVRLVQRRLFRYGFGRHRLAIIGAAEAVDGISHRLSTEPELGYAVRATIPADESGLTALTVLLREQAVDEVLFLDTSLEARRQFFELAEHYHVTFCYAPDLVTSPIGHVALDLTLGVPIIEVPETTIEGWGRVLKRVMDIVGSLCGLIVLAPFFLLAYVMVRRDSAGPALYRSQRMGRHGLFTFYKFRSMKLEFSTGNGYGGAAAEALRERLKAESARRGPVPKIINDLRITEAGKFLRRWSLDELPQLWNVLIGDMSLVGPRPHMPDEVANYEKHHFKVLAVKPGLTGLAQVSGRSDLDFEDEVSLDRYYLENWTPLLDIRILFKTVVAVLAPRKTL